MSNSRRFLVTRLGFAKLKEKYHGLREHRISIIKEVEIAVAQGDLSENAEYHSAKEILEKLNVQLSELTPIIEHFQIGPVPQDQSVVRFGAHVKVRATANDQTSLLIVANPIERMIDDRVQGFDSPMGRAMLGKKAGECFTVGADHQFVVESIDYPES